MRPPSPPSLLPARYHRAWEAVVSTLTSDPHVRGATISGSVLRGEGGPTSDLDVYVLVDGVHRWRRTYACEGVLVEEFRNSEAWIRRYLERQDHIAMHMLGYGTRVLDRTGAFGALCDEARALFDRGPAPLSEVAAIACRYTVWDAWCDAKDLLAADDPVQTLCFLESLVAPAVQAHHAIRRRWPPKGKRLLASLRSWDPTLAALLIGFVGARGADVRAAFAAYDAIVRHVLAPHDPDRPVLWTTPPEPVDDRAPEGSIGR